MKIFHTADLHLGRQFFDYNLIEDQRHILTEIIKLIEDNQPDIIIIAGDVYDRALPSIAATELFEYFLVEVIAISQSPIIVISGNHDNATRLGYLSGLIKNNRIHLVTEPYEKPMPIEVIVGDERALVYALPFVDPHTDTFSHNREIKSFSEYYSVVASEIQSFHESTDANTLPILVAHGFVEGGMETDSERPLTMGGLDHISASNLSFFSYIALGHLHQCHSVGDKSYYSGSPLSYSLSETGQIKFIILAEVTRETLKIKQKALHPLRPLIKISDFFEEILSNAKYQDESFKNAYLQIEILDERQIFESFPRLKEIFPYLVHVDNSKHLEKIINADLFTEAEKEQDDFELIKSFFIHLENKELQNDEIEILQTMIREVEKV